MAYQTPITVSTSDYWSNEDQNDYLRDNMMAMVPDMFTVQSQLFVGSAANVGQVLDIGDIYDLLYVDSSTASGLAYGGLRKSIITRGSNYALSSGDNDISWNSEEVDDLGLYPGSGDEATIVDTGYYWIFAAVATTAAEDIDVKILINGTMEAFTEETSHQGSVPVGCFGSLTAADTIKIRATLASSATFDASDSYFIIILAEKT